jgi:GNAT superfamily N-acetyltransferase
MSPRRGVIRDGVREDLPVLTRLIQSHTALDAATCARRLEGGMVLVYDDGTIKGCGVVGEPRSVEGETRVDAWLYTDPAHRRMGIGGRLWERIRPLVARLAPAVVEVGYRADQGDARAFFAARGFRKWFAMERLRYAGPLFPEVALEAVTLGPQWITEYMQAINECFRQLREAADIRPYAPFSAPAFTDAELQRRLLEDGDNTFLFLVDGQLAGLGATDGRDFVELVAVRPPFRSLGLGRLIIQFCVNRLRQEGAREVYTSVLEINTGARRLYQRLGFEPVEVYEEARLWLPHGEVPAGPTRT